MNLHIRPLMMGVCHGIHDPFSLYCGRGVVLMRCATQIINIKPSCSHNSLSQDSVNHQDMTSMPVNKYTGLGRPALQ